MFEIEMNGTVYKFKFGMGFLRAIEERAKMPVANMPGQQVNVGLEMLVAHLLQFDADELVEVLFLANQGYEPRVTRKTIDAYIDDEDTDIDALLEQVMDFLKKSNATRKKVTELLKKTEEALQ